MTPARIKTLRNLLSLKGADVFVVFNLEESGQPGTRYLSGFTGTSSTLVITEKEKFLITDGRYILQAQREAEGFKIIPQTRKSDLNALLEKLRAKSILFDSSRTFHISVMDFVKKGIELIPDANLLQEIRQVKELAEIKKIQKANDVAIRAFKRLLPHVEAGQSELSIAHKLESLMRDEGADSIAFPAIVASGKNGAHPHWKSSEKKIKKGELIIIDFGAVVEGYCSDITRTVAVGKVSQKLQEMCNIVKQSQAEGIKIARAGVTGKAVDDVCRGVIEKAGYGKYFVHSTGHGLGLEVHELPLATPIYDRVLMEGAVITCEPGIYIEGLGGVRIEDDLVMIKKGNKNLTQKLFRDLIVL